MMVAFEMLGKQIMREMRRLQSSVRFLSRQRSWWRERVIPGVSPSWSMSFHHMLRRERSSGALLTASQSWSRWTSFWQNCFSWLIETPWCRAFAAWVDQPIHGSRFSFVELAEFGRVGVSVTSVVPSGTSCGLVLLYWRAERVGSAESSDSSEALYPDDRLS